MKTSKEVLSSILKTTQMGQSGIRSVMDYAVGTNLRNELQSQLREYDAIETEAHNIASRRGWQVAELNPGIRMMSEMMTRMTLTGSNTSSKVAKMMIQGNTRGMIKGIKNQHRYKQADEPIQSLGNKLIDRETDNIQQMKPFL
jgi:hypothetical protein